jgi:endonuclease/exonuclease/phosphatase family metal-dependent hydrolase
VYGARHKCAGGTDIDTRASVPSAYSGCRRRFLDAGYRRPLILAELLGFNADIICLQEVDEKAFAVYFRPHLTLAGSQQLVSSAAATVYGLTPHPFRVVQTRRQASKPRSRLRRTCGAE